MCLNDDCYGSGGVAGLGGVIDDAQNASTAAGPIEMVTASEGDACAGLLSAVWCTSPAWSHLIEQQAMTAMLQA